MIKKIVDHEKTIEKGSWDSSNVGKFLKKVDVRVDEDHVTYKLTSTVNIDFKLEDNVHIAGSLTK